MLCEYFSQISLFERNLTTEFLNWIFWSLFLNCIIWLSVSKFWLLYYDMRWLIASHRKQWHRIINPKSIVSNPNSGTIFSNSTTDRQLPSIALSPTKLGNHSFVSSTTGNHSITISPKAGHHIHHPHNTGVQVQNQPQGSRELGRIPEISHQVQTTTVSDTRDTSGDEQPATDENNSSNITSKITAITATTATVTETVTRDGKKAVSTKAEIIASISTTPQTSNPAKTASTATTVVEEAVSQSVSIAGSQVTSAETSPAIDGITGGNNGGISVAGQRLSLKQVDAKLHVHIENGGNGKGSGKSSPMTSPVAHTPTTSAHFSPFGQSSRGTRAPSASFSSQQGGKGNNDTRSHRSLLFYLRHKRSFGSFRYLSIFSLIAAIFFSAFQIYGASLVVYSNDNINITPDEGYVINSAFLLFSYIVAVIILGIIFYHIKYSLQFDDHFYVELELKYAFILITLFMIAALTNAALNYLLNPDKTAPYASSDFAVQMEYFIITLFRICIFYTMWLLHSQWVLYKLKSSLNDQSLQRHRYQSLSGKKFNPRHYDSSREVESIDKIMAPIMAHQIEEHNNRNSDATQGTSRSRTESLAKKLKTLTGKKNNVGSDKSTEMKSGPNTSDKNVNKQAEMKKQSGDKIQTNKHEKKTDDRLLLHQIISHKKGIDLFMMHLGMFVNCFIFCGVWFVWKKFFFCFCFVLV